MDDANQSCPDTRRPPGLRFSSADAVAVCAAATWGLWHLLGPWAFFLPVTLAHFFLFCNVFRVPRWTELSWGGLFVLNVCFWAACGQVSWLGPTLVQTPLTLAVIAIAMRRKDYHGIAHRLIRSLRSHDEPRDPVR